MLENKTGVGETCRLSAAAAAGDQKFCRVTRHAAMWRQNVKTKTNKNRSHLKKHFLVEK